MSWRFQRIPSTTARASLLSRALAIVAALLCVGLVLALAGRAPGRLAAEFIETVTGSVESLQDVALLLTPLILTGVAVVITQRIGLWNLGGEGQFGVGALAATAIGLHVNGPEPVMLVAMAAGAVAAGAAWILVPTIARAYAGVNELITTLLLNFVAALLLAWLSTGPWRDRTGGALAATLRVPYEMPPLGDALHWGLPIAVVVAVAVAVLLTFTRFGYEVRIAGSNPGAAVYAGIPVRRRIIAMMLLSGAIAGLAGMIELSGTVHRLQGGISNNNGYLGIMVAVLARGSCVAVLATAALMATLLDAGIILSAQGLNTSAVLAMTGLILFFTAIADELAHYRLVRQPAQTT